LGLAGLAAIGSSMTALTKAGRSNAEKHECFHIFHSETIVIVIMISTA
jgi:hypothetical protein